MKVSNDQLNKEYLKNKFLSEIQRQKIYENTGRDNESNSGYNSRNNTNDFSNFPSKNYTFIPNNRQHISNLSQPKLHKILRNNNHVGFLSNNKNNNNNSRSSGNGNLSYVYNNTYTNNRNVNFPNSHFGEDLKKINLSRNSTLANNSSGSKFANLNPAKLKIKNTNNHLIDHSSKSPSANSFNLYPKNNLNNKSDNLNSNYIKNIHHRNNSIGYTGGNVYLKYPENRFAFIENRIKENLVNNSFAGGFQPQKASTARSALNSSEKYRKSAITNSNNNNNNKIIIIRDQEKEKEDKLFEFFLQYKNLRKNNKAAVNHNKDNSVSSHNENGNFNNNIINNNNSKYQQNPIEESYLGKLSSLNNSNISKNFSKQVFNELLDNLNTKRVSSPANKITNNNLDNKQQINENIKNVKFDENSESYFRKNKNNNFSNSYQQKAKEKVSYASKFINNPYEDNNNNYNNSKDLANLPLIDMTHRRINDNCALNDFNKSLISNNNLNKYSNSHENFYNNNNYNKGSKIGINFTKDNTNNNLNLRANGNIDNIKADLEIFNDKINSLLLNKKFAVFDELITYAYTKVDFDPAVHVQGDFFEEENLNEKDLQIIENNYENGDQELMEQENNFNNNFVKSNFDNQNENSENWENENYENWENENINNNKINDNTKINNSTSIEEAKFNKLKVNILKLNLFVIMRIFTKYKKINFYSFLQKLRIFSDNIKIFNTADNFLFFDNKFKLDKLDRAVAYRKLQYAAKLIFNRRSTLKHYFKVWQDLVFNFDLNPENKYNSNRHNKYIFTDYYNFPKNVLNNQTNINNNNNINTNNNCHRSISNKNNYTNQLFSYPANLTDDNLHSNSLIKFQKSSNNYESQTAFGFAEKDRSNTQENLNSNANFNNNNSNNINNNYSISNNDIKNKISNNSNKQNLILNPLKNKISNFSIDNSKSLTIVKKESKPFSSNNNYMEDIEEASFSKDQKEIKYINKLNSLAKNNDNNNKNKEADSDDMPMSNSEDEEIHNKLVINNFERVNSEDYFSLQKGNFNNHVNNDNNNINNESEFINSFRTKIFKNFIQTLERKRTEMLKAHIVKAIFFKLFVLKALGETPLKEIIQKRQRAYIEYILRKFEAIKILNQILLRKKNEAKNILIANLGYVPALGMLDSMLLDENSINFLGKINENNFNISINTNSFVLEKGNNNNNDVIDLFKVYKTFAANLSNHNLLNVAEYLKKKLPENIKIKCDLEANDIDFLAELIMKNWVDDSKLELFRGLFKHDNAFEFMKIKSLSNLGNNNNAKYLNAALMISGELNEMYLNENENEQSEENEKYNKMTNLFLGCDTSDVL